MTSNYIIEQNKLADSLFESIQNVYKGYWEISDIDHPMINNTVFITYKDYKNKAPGETLLDCFGRWYRDFVKGIAIEQGSSKRKWVLQRKPTGMYAMDYAASRSGRRSDMKVGGHVQALLVLHPEMADMVKRHLDQQAVKLGSRFYWQMYEDKKLIRDTIHYNLKGIMWRDGFYQGRGDQYDVVGPNLSIPFVGQSVSKAEAA